MNSFIGANAVIGVKVKPMEDISMEVLEEVRYDNVPTNAEKTDTKTIVRVGYVF